MVADALSGRLVVQDDVGTHSTVLEDGAGYPGLPGVSKTSIHVSADPAIRFNLVEFAAGSEVPPHASRTMNYWFVLAGSIESVVPGREPVTLERGDCCVQAGVDHGWRVRDDACAALLAVVVDMQSKPELSRTDAW